MEKEKIIFCLINTEQYRHLLDDIPHRELEDLSVIYYEMSERGDSVLGFELISNSAAEKMKLEEPELYRLAKKNTRKWFPPVVRPMENFIRKFDMNLNEVPEKPSNYVITNQYYKKGAVSILYEDVMEKLAQEIGTDLYLLPTSVNQFIAVPAEEKDLDRLAEIVHFINVTEVELQERLSNQVYRYDKETKQISLASDNIYKKLESVRAEWFEDENETEEDNSEERNQGMNM